VATNEQVGALFPGAPQHHPGENRLLLLAQMKEFIETALASVDRARSRVFIESYIVKPGRLGEALLSRLERAAGRGLDVRLLYDASGSHTLPRERLQALRAAGVRARPYGAAPELGVLRPGFRDHSRLVLADDEAFTGGHAWDDRWLPQALGGGGWSDLNCQVMGPVVRDWAALFEQRWREAPRGWPASFDTRTKYPSLRLISDGPGWRRAIAETQMTAFARSRRRVLLAHAYFFPSRRFVRELYDVRGRGVEVTVLVPAHSDLALVQRAARAQYRSWMRHRLVLYEYLPGMMHGKYAVVDDAWATVGSYNALASSLRLTVETNVVSTNRRFVEQVAARFAAQLEESRLVTDRDNAGRGVCVRLVDRLCWLVMIALNRVLHAVA
jgi:cardiolipin synthase